MSSRTSPFSFLPPKSTSIFSTGSYCHAQIPQRRDVLHGGWHFAWRATRALGSVAAVARLKTVEVASIRCAVEGHLGEASALRRQVWCTWDKVTEAVVRCFANESKPHRVASRVRVPARKGWRVYKESLGSPGPPSMLPTCSSDSGFIQYLSPRFTVSSVVHPP